METEPSPSKGRGASTPNYRRGNLSIQVVKQDAYNVISVLRSYLGNLSGYSAASNLVPILGADATVLKTNEQKLIKRFKALAFMVVEEEPCFLELEHLHPFFDVFKTFDTRYVKLLVPCVEALTNLARSDLLCFKEEEAAASINKVFSEVLGVFSNVVELKEDFLLLKVFDCFEHLYRSHYGNFVTNENTCAMFKLFLNLLSIRNRNTFFKRVFYSRVVDVLMSTFGNRDKYSVNNQELARRVNSVYLFLSLLSGLSNRFNYLGYHTEDSYLYFADKDTMLSFRAHLTPILSSLLNVPAYFNEFTDDMRRMGLSLFVSSVESRLVNLSNTDVVPILQAHFTHSIYKLLFTESITMYALVLRSLWNLFLHFRTYLKAQMELFFTHLIASVTNHVTAARRTRPDMLEMNMEFLAEITKNTDLLLEVFVNFDCDVRCSNLFSLFVKCLFTCLSTNQDSDQSQNKQDQAKAKKGQTKSPPKKATQQYKSNAAASESVPQLNLETFALDALQSIFKFLLSDQSLCIERDRKDGPAGTNLEAAYLQQKRYKDKIMKCSSVFNEGKEDEWMAKGKELGVLSKRFTDKEAALFLKYAPELDLVKLGEYLATHKNPDFMDRVRRTFCQFNYFAGMPIVMAIRLFLSSFRLPGESQQIERLIEIFSKVYFTSQPRVHEDEVPTPQAAPLERGGAADADAEGLKLARWVIQEDFYHKHRLMQQVYSRRSTLGQEGPEESDNSWKALEEGPEGQSSDLRDASAWAKNMDMYNYFLSNDPERAISAQNYRRICEYLKNTPVTMETQTTCNESVTDASGQSRDGDTNRSVSSTETSKTSTSANAQPAAEEAGEAESTSLSAQSSVHPPEKVRLETKPGFAYVQDYNAIFVLCYSIIMLNTDLHNSQVKNKMKLEDFIRNNKGTNDGKNFSSEFLQDIYRTIKFHEIKLHSSLSLSTAQYEPYLWSDYVLLRQKQLSQYLRLGPVPAAKDGGQGEVDPDSPAAGAERLKLSLFDVVLKNDLLEVLDNLLVTCRNVDVLKKVVELLWLLVRVGLKHANYDLVNSIFQLPGVDVSYSLGYKCQVSISFILNVLAVSSEYFDQKSWAKSLDIVTRLYCLNLLPPPFAALEGDHRLFSDHSNDLAVPSIRFKRLTDRKTSSWLVGLSNLMPFTKGTTSPEGPKHAKKEGEPESNETFLFLFDVQMSSKQLLENRFFDVYLLRNKFSPVYSSEDEATINNVTKTLSSESDREELLPPILTYINLRLAFLNIYKLDDLFMGTILCTQLDSFTLFLSVIVQNIFEAGQGEQESDRESDSSRERDNFGNILDPNYGELDRFREKISAIFNLGIFSRLALQLLTRAGKHKSLDPEFLLQNADKRRMLMSTFIGVFYHLAKRLVVGESLNFMPTVSEMQATLGLDELSPELLRAFESKESLEDVFANYVSVMLLNLVFWMVDYFNNHKDMETPTAQGFRGGEEGADFATNQVGSSRSGGSDSVDLSLIDLTTWLLHIFINFDNALFNQYLDPVEKLLYNLADSVCISRNTYMVNVVLCAIQRLVNPYLPFGSDPLKRVTPRSMGSILTLLLRRSKCLSWNNPYVAKLTAQTLLSIALYSNTSAPEKVQANPRGSSPAFGPKDATAKAKKDYTENLLAIQLLIEFNSFANDDNNENLEHLWLLSLHSLSLIFSVGPKEISNEAMKGLNKLLLQQEYPVSGCTFTSQVARIFDYVLSPMLSLDFHYPLPTHVQVPLDLSPKVKGYSIENYALSNPFQPCKEGPGKLTLWMSRAMNEYLNNFAFRDFDDLAARKAAATNLICHALLSKVTPLMTERYEQLPADLLKSSASNLECLLYDATDKCETGCIKRLVVLAQYVLNVIIPSNGEIHTGISRDTYLETLKNFILVLLTSPELKDAPESCRAHFKNDAELKGCLEVLAEQITFDQATPGEYTLSSLLAHTFSSSDSLKNLFLEVLKVVFPRLDPEPAPAPAPA